MKKYVRNIFRILTIVSVVITLLVFITGKTELTEYIKIFRNQFGETSDENTSVNYNFLEGTDNLLTTIFKTFFVILAVIFMTMASIISGFLEIIIWAVSLGRYKFYCTGEIWDLLWTRIIGNWYWTPSKSLYLCITYLFYSGFFGTGSVERNKVADGKDKGTRKIRR
ncbi:MAG: hypothetical protein JNL17_15975 [Cyclobacteriaceae bacterium]|nr:hypothetical protein [Cyclobacteriaceae bacterium]